MTHLPYAPTLPSKLAPVSLTPEPPCVKSLDTPRGGAQRRISRASQGTVRDGREARFDSTAELLRASGIDPRSLWTPQGFVEFPIEASSWCAPWVFAGKWRSGEGFLAFALGLGSCPGTLGLLESRTVPGGFAEPGRSACPKRFDAVVRFTGEQRDPGRSSRHGRTSLHLPRRDRAERPGAAPAGGEHLPDRRRHRVRR